MKIRIIKPVLSDGLNEITEKEVLLIKALDTEIEIVNIHESPTNIGCFYNEVLA